MDIDIRTRKTSLNDRLRENVDHHFAKVGKQVSSLTTLHLELRAEQNPSIADDKVVEARLHLKGTVLRAQAASADMAHSIELASEKLSRQVKRYNEKRRNHRGADPAQAA